MHDQNLDPAVGPLDPVVARNQRSALLRNPVTNPTQDALDFALTKLVTANIRKAIQTHLEPLGTIRLHPAQVEYLVGLIEAAGERK